MGAGCKGLHTPPTQGEREAQGHMSGITKVTKSFDYNGNDEGDDYLHLTTYYVPHTRLSLSHYLI